jgi:hypothetical protein
MCRGRQALPPSEFHLSDELYRGFTADDLDEEGRLDAESLRLPDLSCNWSRFSIPEDGMMAAMPSLLKRFGIVGLLLLSMSLSAKLTRRITRTQRFAK